MNTTKWYVFKVYTKNFDVSIDDMSNVCMKDIKKLNGIFLKNKKANRCSGICGLYYDLTKKKYFIIKNSYAVTNGNSAVIDDIKYYNNILDGLNGLKNARIDIQDLTDNDLKRFTKKILELEKNFME